MKNKRLSWTLAIFSLILSSYSALALSNPLQGLGGKIGGLSGWGIVVMNAAIIAAILYFGVSLIPKLDIKKNASSHGVFIVIIVIMSIMFAIHIKNTIGNEFLWSVPAAKGAFRYLFTDQYTLNGRTFYGILHPAHLWKFIGLSLVIAWLFVSFFDVGKGKHLIDISLAIILAANAVHNGMSLVRVVQMGRIIALLILTHQFSKSFGIGNERIKWVASIAVAFFLVASISNVVFPGVPLIGDEAAAPGAGADAQQVTSPSFWVGLIITVLIAIVIAFIIITLAT